MIKQSKPSRSQTKLRTTLSRRIRSFYRWFNQGRDEKCYTYVDPQLREESKLKAAVYSESLRAFRHEHGSVQIWFIRSNLYPAKTNPRDPRPFAYVYLLWQDDRHEFQLFRERWVHDGERWYTRVVGLVPSP